jgi:hypothetical protein
VNGRADRYAEHNTQIGHRDFANDDDDARRPIMPADPFQMAADSG